MIMSGGVGSVRLTSWEELDVKVLFMYPHGPCGPAMSYFWARNENVCRVPLYQLIRKASVPTAATGLINHLKAQDIDKIKTKYLKCVIYRIQP